MIRVITEKDLIDYIGKYDYIIVPMNCYGNFGNGFSYKVKTYYPYVEMMENHMTNYGDKNKLGTVFEVKFKKRFCRRCPNGNSDFREAFSDFSGENLVFQFSLFSFEFL